MGLIGKLLGSDKAITKGGEVIDKAFFTDQEKAEQFCKLLKSYEAFKVAQRLLAIIISIPYVCVVLVASIVYVYGIFQGPCFDQMCDSGYYRESANGLIAMSSEALGVSFSLVMSLYFGGGLLEGAIRASSSNKKDS